MRYAYKSCVGELGGKRPFGIPWHSEMVEIKWAVKK
jgi:hypothetical protein